MSDRPELPKDFPRKIGNSYIKQCTNGAVKIVCHDKVAEQWLDQHCTRIDGRLQWWPEFDLHAFATVREHIENQLVYIIGKGPSLDNLSLDDFSDYGTIIAINDSINKVEALPLESKVKHIFMMQQDSILSDKAHPKKATAIVSAKAARHLKTYEPKVIYYPGQLGHTYGSLTTLCAISMCKRLGVREFVMLCFDACLTKNCDYAKCIGYRPDLKTGKERFLAHGKLIQNTLQRLGIKYSFRPIRQSTLLTQ